MILSGLRYHIPHLCGVFSGDHIFLLPHVGLSATGGIISPVLLSVYVKNIPKHSCQIEQSRYADGTALLLVKYLGTYLDEMETCLRD